MKDSCGGKAKKSVAKAAAEAKMYSPAPIMKTWGELERERGLK